MMNILAFALLTLARVHQGRRLQSPPQSTSRHGAGDGPELVNCSADVASELQGSRLDERVIARDLRAPSAVFLAGILEAVAPVSGFNPSGRFREGVLTATSLDRRTLDVKNSVASKKEKVSSPEPQEALKRYRKEKKVSVPEGKKAALEKFEKECFLALEKMKAKTKKNKVQPVQPKKKVVMPTIPMSKIRVGDYVVHSAYGIGEFMGVFNIAEVTGGPAIRYVRIRYRDGNLDIRANDAKDELRLFERKEEAALRKRVRLDSADSTEVWDKRKRKAAEKVYALATDLVKTSMNRSLHSRKPCPPDNERYKKFEEAFEYKPTADQLKAFAAIHDDMVLSHTPMDRVVIGEVGYGKTEVAMRAIYRMVIAGRQVAMLVPTRVLAAQHLRTLRARMPDLRIELLSTIVTRLHRVEERKSLFNAIETGEVDVVIGTSALLAPSVKFQDMGLLVVDEEQRFGVKQKEQFMNASATIDVLTLTATPIPRTMYMCMAGVRDVSKLLTAPKGRKPIKTIVGARDDRQIPLAINREISRGGQIFYVLPQIAMLQEEIFLLEEMLPKGTRVIFAHGQMHDLEERIVSFALGNYDVLVATSILETGIDIPNVNTIIIQEAQLFGLSQLHQLRGRVGRSNVQAYAYLMHSETLSDGAQERLASFGEAMQSNVGEVLSVADLKQRGSGHLFGGRWLQFGQVGTKTVMRFEMYMEVLQRMMKYVVKKEKHGLQEEPDLDAMMFQRSVEETVEA